MLNYALLVIFASASIAQTSPPDASGDDTSRPVQIDPAALPVDEHVTAPAAEAADRGQPATTAPAGDFTLDTPIGTLIADAAAKRVLDHDLPGLSEDANLPKFEGLSLREFQPLTGGQLDDALLAKVGRDLAAAGAPAVRAKPAVVEGR
jgi:hypothetical protein